MPVVGEVVEVMVEELRRHVTEDAGQLVDHTLIRYTAVVMYLY